MAKRLEDTDLMPNGKYKGEKMANVPASYLVWGYLNDRLVPEVHRYVKSNWELIEKEAQDEKNKKQREER